MAQLRIPEPILEVSESEWRRFKKEFKIYLIAAEKDEKVKVSLFFNLIGSEASKLYECSASRTRKETLEKIFLHYDNYFAESKNVIFERFKFRNISQKDGENFNKFCLRLRQQALRCEYKEEDEMVRDSIVFGVKDLEVRKELLKEKKLSLEQAIEICRYGEATRERLQAMESVKTVDHEECNVHAINEKLKRNDNQKQMIHDCKWCGLSHVRGRCPAYGKTCSKCMRKNHFKAVCGSFPGQSTSKVQELNGEECSYDVSINNECLSENVLSLGILAVTSRSGDVWIEKLSCNGKTLKVKIDSGAQVNVMSVRDSHCLGINELFPTNTVIEAFGGKKYIPKGSVNVNLSWKNELIKTSFLVIDGCDQPILGLRDARALRIINLVSELKCSNTDLGDSSDKIKFIEKYSSLFEGLGCLPIKHHISVKSDISPVICPSRRIPFRLRDRLKIALDKLVERRIIEKIDKPTAWVSNMVIAEKANGDLRICLDPKFLNKAIKREHSYIPTQEDAKVALQGKSVFTVLDMKDGYYHVELDEASSDLCTFSTPFGRYKYLRLPFGICSAPEVFQKRAMSAFEGIDNVWIYFDDLIISTKDEASHDLALAKVMERADKWGIRFNNSKVQFKQKSVKYLGLVFSKNGVEVDKHFLESVTSMPEPKNVKEIQMLMGLCSYVSEFLPNLSSVSAPLRKLMKKDST